MKKLKTVFFIVVLAFITLSVSAKKKYTLRVNPDVGNKIVQNLSIVLDIDFDGKNFLTDLSMKFDMTNRAKKDSLFLFDVICTEIKAKVDMDGMKMNYDSKNPGSDELSKQMRITFGKITNKTIKFSLNQLGATSGITLPDGDEEDFPFEKSIYIATQLPKQAIGIGDSWTTKRVSDQSGVVNETKMTLVEVNEHGYKINVEGKILTGTKEVGYIRGFCVLDKKTCMTKIIDLTSESMVLNTKMKSIIKYN